MSNNSILHKSFVYTQFKFQTVLFDPRIRSYQVLSLRRANLGVMAMKEHSTFPIASASLEPHHEII